MKRLAALCMLSSLPLLALAGAKKIPTYDVSTAEAALESAKDFGFTTEGKPAAYPKKVAIGYFQVRVKTRQANQQVVITLKFEDEDYQALTDMLYSQLEERLIAEGMEVVPKEQVLASAAYQALEGGDEERDGGNRVRFAATGMKNLPTFSGAPRKPGKLAALNAELGTDAVVAAFVNYGLCDLNLIVKAGYLPGVYSCLRGDLSRPGFNLLFVGGAKGSGDKVKPQWTARVFKETQMYNYNKKEKLVHDMALISPSKAMDVTRRSFWKGKEWGAMEESFITGSSAVFNDALTMGFEWWEKKHGAARQAAGVERTFWSAVAAPAAPAAPAGPDAPGTHEVPPLAGAVSCYFGTTSTGEVALRRALDAGSSTIVEDQISFNPGQAPYRSLTTWTVEGAAATVAEARGTWTGTAELQGEPWAWTGWTVELAMGNDMSARSTTAVEDGCLVSTAEIARAGEVFATVDQKLDPVDEAACNEKFSTVAPVAP